MQQKSQESMSGIKYGLDADRNICTGDDMVLMKTTPLSEMVWSQTDGLGCQYVASTLAEKKVSLLWNTESFNIAISSPQRANCEDASNIKDHSEGDSSPLPLNPEQEEKTSDAASLHGSPRDTNNRTFGELKLSNRIGVDVDVKNLENNISADKERENNTSSFLHIDTEAVDMLCDTEAVDMMRGKGVLPGPHNHGRSAECMSRKTMELMPEIPLMDVESPTKSTSGSKSTCGGIDFTVNAALDGGTRLNHHKRKCCEVQFLQDSKGETKDDFFRASLKGKSPLIESPAVVKCSNARKGKAKAISISEQSQSISNKSADSCESVESCNSKRLNIKGKRARGYDLKISVGNKRLKKQIIEGSSSGSFRRQNSSFLNWVSTITNGAFRFSDATPLACIPGPSHHTNENLDCLPLSQAEGIETDIACRNMGFKSIFQSLYPPGRGVQNSANAAGPINTYQEQSKRVELKLHSFFHSKSEWFNVGDINEVSKKREKLNQVTNHAKELPSTIDSTSHQNTKHDLMQTSVGPSHSSKNGTCQSLFNRKEAGALVAVSESSLNSASNNRNKLLQNLWITRFCPKPSTIPNSVQCEQGKNSPIEKSLVKGNSVDSKGHVSSHNSCFPTVQHQRSVTNVEKLGSLKKEESKEENGKLKLKLIPIIPSDKSLKSKVVVSSFAKRLGVLKNINHTKVSNGTKMETTACSIGKGGYEKGECS